MKYIAKLNTTTTETKKNGHKGSYQDSKIAGVIKVSPESLKDFEEIEYEHLKELSKKKTY